MTPIEYCYQKVAPRGSSLYLSIRSLSMLQRDAIVAIYAFYQEIEEITLLYHDVSVAQAKLNWWRDQVIMMQDGKPDHPVAIALQHCLKTSLRFIDLIDGLEQNLFPPRFVAPEDIVIHMMRTAGVRDSLVATVLQPEGFFSSESLYQCTLVCEWVHYLQHLRRYIHRDLFYFSQAELQQHQLTEQDFKTYKTTSLIQALLQSQADKVERCYRLVKDACLPIELSYFMIRCDMAMAILHAMQRQQFCVLERFIDISPLRYWWIASWR